MEQDQAALIAEQLGRLADKIGARLDKIEASLASHEALEAERTRGVRSDIDEMKEDIKDHENRIRDVVSQTTRNQTILGFSTGGAMLASIAAAIKAFMVP